MNRSSNKSYRHSANYARHMPHMNGAYKMSGVSDINSVNRMTRDITDIPIGRRLDELVNELQYVSDPVERIILTNLIRIKQKQNVIMEQRTGKTGDTESLDSLSGDEIYDVDSIDTSTDDVDKAGHKAGHKVEHKSKRANRRFKRSGRSNAELEELELSEKTRMNSLKEIKKKELQKLREEAYQEMLESEMDTDDEGGEGGEDGHNNEDIDGRRDEETDESDDMRWGATIKDPRYDNYVREDKLNNKMMERLNTEIDFRTEARSSEIIKPFDDADGMLEEQHQQYQRRRSRRRRD